MNSTFLFTENSDTKSGDDDGPRREALRNLRFGAAPTSHMASVVFNREFGWHDPRIVPFGAFKISPMSRALHYGQGIFEGMKVYRSPDGSLAAFRPDLHAARFARSAERMAMPPLPQELFIGAVDALLAVDGTWVPEGRGSALYMRPFMFATEEALGFRPSDQYQFCLFGSPAGTYYDGPPSIRVWVTREFTRAALGGTGAAKCIGNYGGSLLAHTQAVAAGCDQALWLDAVEHEFVEELGGMNVLALFKMAGRAVLVTPPTSGTILDGVTRSTLLDLAGELDLVVEQRPLRLDEVQAGADSGELLEMYACGTAVGLTSIVEVKDGDRISVVGDGQPGPVARMLRERLLDVQHGYSTDHADWRHGVGAVAAW